MKFELELSDNGYAAYLRFPDHPGKGTKVARTVSLVEVMGAFNGPYIVFDFDKSDRMIGAEFIAVNPEEEEDDNNSDND